MTDTITDPRMWARAADVIDARGWAQDIMEDDAGAVCLTGAIRACQMAPGDWPIARAVARHRGHGEMWNDAEGRTRDEVTAWLRSAAPITDAELADVFGPQAEHVVDLVRRAAVLTESEAAALAAKRAAAGATAWDATGTTAWDAAWAAAGGAVGDAAWALVGGAVGDAARATAWGAARDAARAAPWGAAREAAGDAAGALAARDLITTDGPWRQEHYNVLVRPWTVVGPAHPDDQVTA